MSGAPHPFEDRPLIVQYHDFLEARAEPKRAYMLEKDLEERFDTGGEHDPEMDAELPVCADELCELCGGKGYRETQRIRFICMECEGSGNAPDDEDETRCV